MALFENEIKSFLESFSPLLAAFPFLRHRFGGFGPWNHFLVNQEKHVNLLLSEVHERRQNSTGRQDILSLLLAARDEEGRPMTDEELVDELRTLLMAGHETTAVSLSWALYEIHRHPKVLEQLRAELAPLGSRPSPEELEQQTSGTTTAIGYVQMST